MATPEEIRAQRIAESVRQAGGNASIAASSLLDRLTETGRERLNFAGNVARSLVGADTVPFTRFPLTEGAFRRLGMGAPDGATVPLTAAPTSPPAAARSGNLPAFMPGPANDGWLGPYGWSQSVPLVAPAPVAPAPAAPVVEAPVVEAAPAPAVPQGLPAAREALRYTPRAAPVVPATDPVYDRWDSPSGRRIDAFLERELTGGVGVTNQMLAARQQQQVYDMRRSPQWEAEYQAARRNVGDTAAAAIADQNVAMATPGMSSAFEALLAPAARQAVQNARSEGAAVAATANRPELNAPYYGGDLAAYGPIQGFDADAYGNPAVSFRAGDGAMSPFVALDNTTSNYGLGVTAGEGGFPAVQERTDRSIAALNEGFNAREREAARLAEQQRLLQTMFMRYSSEAELARQRARNQAIMERQETSAALLGLGP